MPEQEKTEFSIFSARRLSPGHHWARAENARFCARILVSVPKRLANTVKRKTRYEGTPEIALREAYIREAALSLELIVKAVIAQRIESHGNSAGHKSVPTNHNVPRLWDIAELPRLPISDRYRLLTAAGKLQWSGRYAAPREDKEFFREQKEWQALRALENAKLKTNPLFRTNPGFAWKDVNRIFKIAEKELRRMQGLSTKRRGRLPRPRRYVFPHET